MRVWKLMAVAGVVAGIATGCQAKETAVPVTATVAPTDVTSRFVAAVKQGNPVTGFGDADLVSQGQEACSWAGVAPRANIVVMMQTSDRVANSIMDNAIKYLCPGKSYTYAPPVTVPVVEVDRETIDGDGTYEVGPGKDLKPGIWRSTGGNACYWARLKDLDDTVDSIIANNFGEGPAVVNIKAGEYFKSQECGSWSLVK